MERIRLDQDAVEIELPKQLWEHGTLMVGVCGVAGLRDLDAERSRIERHLGDERRTAATGGLDRTSQALGITDQLIEISCPAWNLGNYPVTDRRLKRGYVHLLEAVAERGIRWRPPYLDANCLGEHSVAADGKTLKLPQALAAAQGHKVRDQQEVPGRALNSAPHARIQDRPQIIDPVEIDCSGDAFKHKKGAIPPTSAHVDNLDKDAYEGLSNSPASLVGG